MNMTLIDIINDTDLPPSKKQQLTELVSENVSLKQFKDDVLKLWAIRRKFIFGSEPLTDDEAKQFTDLQDKLSKDENEYYKERISKLENNMDSIGDKP